MFVRQRRTLPDSLPCIGRAWTKGSVPCSAPRCSAPPRRLRSTLHLPPGLRLPLAAIWPPQARVVGRAGRRKGPRRTEAPSSLLERLRQPFDPEPWTRFVSLYAPLIYSWGRRAGLQQQDAADLAQEVFLTLR